MALRDYVGDGIVVHWDSDACFHSERCTSGLPSVFDRSARPWVRLDGAVADEVARVVDRCPSGALTYTRTDGRPVGRRGRPAADAVPSDHASASAGPSAVRALPGEQAQRAVRVTITPLRNGPLSVVGAFALELADHSTRDMRRVQLCRCGHSGTKPVCDGSHDRVGFSADGVDPDD